MMRWLVFCLLLISFTCQAGIDPHRFNNPELEARYKHLINELRCLVCQNQNIADSNASLAKTLREETLRMINEGASDEDIIRFMVTRYGDFVLYNPPFKTSTALLWSGPFILLLLAFAVAVIIVRRNRAAASADVTGLEDARKLLDGESDRA